MKLYTRYNCSACENVKQYLDAKHVGYETINIEDDYDATMFLVDKGIRSVPTLFVNEYEYLIGSAAIKTEV